MLQFIARRFLVLIPVLFAISFVSFIIIELPPGDYLTSYISNLAAQGQPVQQDTIASLTRRYGLDQPFHVRYWRWISGIITRGDFGHSMEWNRPVRVILWERLGFTFVLAFASLIFTWVVAFLIGAYSAARQYSIGDYVFSFLGFVGLATPDFLAALVVMWVALSQFGISAGGLFSSQYQDAPWSLPRVGDLLQHLWIPMVIVGIGGTAYTIRIFRANLLDELHRPYVEAARSRGMAEWRLLLKYPIRVALNPFVSTVGWILPGLVSGSVIVSVVLNLPTTGPLLLRALTSQDMYLAGSFVFMLSVLTVVGTLLSDILLAWLDPRIRLQ
jgi:peptide/nickel transport system permease protein